MARIASHTHRDGGPTCSERTRKACDDRYSDWQAMQQVLLAYRIAASGRRIKEDNVFAQLIDLIGGHRENIMTKEGNPNVTPWVARLRSAMERVKSGVLPEYNLYMIPGLDSEQQGGM